MAITRLLKLFIKLQGKYFIDNWNVYKVTGYTIDGGVTRIIVLNNNKEQTFSENDFDCLTEIKFVKQPATMFKEKNE